MRVTLIFLGLAWFTSGFLGGIYGWTRKFDADWIAVLVSIIGGVFTGPINGVLAYWATGQDSPAPPRKSPIRDFMGNKIYFKCRNGAFRSWDELVAYEKKK